MEKGLVMLSDILSSEGGLLSFECFTEKVEDFNMVDFFRLLGIFDALPHEWKRALQLGTDNRITNKSNEENYIDLANIEKITSRNIYKYMISTISKPHTAQLKYVSLFPDVDFDWNHIYSLTSLITTSTKLREFQYKIINRIVFTNVLLAKAKMVVQVLALFVVSSTNQSNIFLLIVNTL